METSRPTIHRFVPALGLFLAIIASAADNKPQTQSGLSGGVVDAITGEPLKKAQVTLYDSASDRTYAASTDESGAFSVTAVEAGTYEILAQKRGYVQTGRVLTLKAGQTAAAEIMRLTPQGVVAGRVADRSGDPIPNATVQAIQSFPMGAGRRYSVAGSATTNDLGEYRIFGLNPGRYVLGGAYRRDSGYAAVYFPDAQEVNRAVSVDVPAGGELHAINLTMGEPHSVTIRGAIRGTVGLPVQGIMVVAAPCDAGPLNRVATTVQKSNGVFELRPLTPGCYVLAADTFIGGKRFSARLPLTVADKNIEDLHLSLVPPVQLTGRVRSEDAALPFQQVIVNLESRLSKVTATGAPAADGGLVLNNIVPETYELNVTVPDGYYLKSAKLGETDALRSGLDLSHGDGGRLELEINGDGGRIDGVVAGAGDQPIEGARVALVADDQSAGFPRPKVTVSGPKGTFSIRGIAPGDYRIYAAQNLDVTALRDTAYTKQLEPRSQSISIREHAMEHLLVKAIAADAIPIR